MTGQELKQKIDRLGVKQNVLAEKMGVTPQTVSAILGAKDVRSSSLERIAAALGVDMSFFYPAKTVTETTTNITRTKAHNLHTGNGDITENNGTSDDVLAMLVKQNQDLINMLKAERAAK